MAPWGLSLPEWGRGSGNGEMWRCKDEMRSPAPAFRAAAPFLEHPVMFLKHRGVRVSLIRSVQTGSAFLPLHPHHHSLSALNRILSGVWVLSPRVWPWGLHAGQGFQWLLLLTLPWGSSPFLLLFCLLLLLLVSILHQEASGCPGAPLRTSCEKREDESVPSTKGCFLQLFPPGFFWLRGMITFPLGRAGSVCAVLLGQQGCVGGLSTALHRQQCLGLSSSSAELGASPGRHHLCH